MRLTFPGFPLFLSTMVGCFSLETGKSLKSVLEAEDKLCPTMAPWVCAPAILRNSTSLVLSLLSSGAPKKLGLPTDGRWHYGKPGAQMNPTPALQSIEVEVTEVAKMNRPHQELMLYHY